MSDVSKVNGKLYRNHAVQAATREELATLGKELGIRMTEEELTEFQEKTAKFAGLYDRIAELSETVGDIPPVKYARTGGRKPALDENQYNAWTYKCQIPGAVGGKLSGKRVAVKDNVSVAGVPMMNGSHIMDTYIPKYDATVVTRLLDAGATIVGKSTCEDFCFSGASIFSATGPVKNPLDPTRTTGGSSSGSGALLAAGEVDLAIGGDQGGSVRIPASWCGVVGLKPTFGLVPYTGACTVEATVDHLGPMARTVKDCAAMLEAMAGYDPLDPRQNQTIATKWNFTTKLTGDVQGKKIALVREGFDVCTEGVQQVVRAAVDSLGKLGVTVEEISLPAHKDARRVWFGVELLGGFSTTIDQSGLPTGCHGYHDVDFHSHLFHMQQTRRNEWSTRMKMFALHGSYMKKHYGNKFYGKAANLVPWLTAEYDRVLDQFDVLVMPTLLSVAPKLPLEHESLHSAYDQINTNVASTNLTGHPALSMNAGYSDGLPVGVMFIGNKFDEMTVLNFAHALEQLNTS